VLVQEGKLARVSFPPWSNDVRDVPMLMQEGKLACTSFPPRWNDVVRDVFLCFCKREIQQKLSFPHGGMMLFEMHLCCSRGKASTH
jgi:hypothetical protein